MRIIVTFETEVPDSTFYDDIQSWLEYELNANGFLKSENRLFNTQLEADSFSVNFEEEKQ